MRATEIAAMLAAQAEAVCHHLLPQGRIHGKDWCCGSLGGEPGNSLKVRLAGHKAGVWSDFGGAQDDRGDLIGLWQRTRNVDLVTACEEAMDWLQIPESQRENGQKTPYIRPIRTEVRAPSQTWLRLQSSLRPGTLSELSALATLRKLPATAGLELATRCGQLWFADVFDDGFDWPAWIITDGARCNAQARRIDGQPWAGIGGKKAKTIHGCEASWPIGIAEAATEIALVEGGPDFLSAWHLVWFMDRVRDISPVAMLGAGNPIHPKSLPLFTGKKVWVFPHSDDNLAGQKAAEQWSRQLREAGADPEPFDLGSRGVKDLNELVIAGTKENLF